MTIPEQHQLRVAQSALKKSELFAQIVNGMTHEEARKIIDKLNKAK